MRLILDPAEDAAHGEWLRGTPGAYEWWYFDALSDNREWALTCIWFLGNPFSPYYRLAALGQPANPYNHNALFFALYHWGKLHAYHFTRFPLAQVEAAEELPGELRFGTNRLVLDGHGLCHIAVFDENANRRKVAASLTFTSPPAMPPAAPPDPQKETHFWLPAVPFSHVTGHITLREARNAGSENITFSGTGYHDHNWGRLPFADHIQDWYWARIALEGERAILIYHVRYRDSGRTAGHLLLFERGQLVQQDDQPRTRLSRPAVNSFGTSYATCLTVTSGDLHVRLRLRSRLDSAPFYLRALCEAQVTQNGQTELGWGMGEYFRPRIMSWPLVASAMKARILEA